MKYKVGYDLMLLQKYGVKIPIQIKPDGNLIVVGSSNSGKSTSLLFFLHKIKKGNNIDLTICDFKCSHEFTGITSKFAEFEDCYDMICEYYEDFLATPEGGNGKIKILLIDEIAGLLTFLSMNPDGKKKADKIRQIMASILMLGRSRKCFLWLSMQRYTASIFPSASGAADNFHFCIGLGKLSVEGRKGLFAGEHFDGEETIQFGQGKGIILIDGEPIKSIVIPKVSKQKLLSLLQQESTEERA